MSDSGDALGFQGTYPNDDAFWLVEPKASSDGYPWRYGDILNTPVDVTDVQDSKGRPWAALMVVHPNCDLGAKGAPRGVQVVRVRPLKDVAAKHRAAITAGFRQDATGRVLVAFAHAVYLAGVPGTPLWERMFANLRDTARVDRAVLESAGRVAAMSHEARVAVITRDVQFRYRWGVFLEQVYQLEARRTGNDANFLGPRPSWAFMP